MKLIHTIASITAALALSTPLIAQDEKPLAIGDFDNTGSVTAGYRFTGVNGYQPMYRNLFDLNSGFRVLGVTLFGQARKGTSNAFADDYSLVSNGLGGEPWSTTQLTVRKKNLYELRAAYRQSYYYVDPNSSAASPAGLSGLLSDHSWATVRKMGSFNLLFHATSQLRFTMEYSRNTRDGAQDTTRVMDYFGAPSSFGSFERANPYYLVGLLNEDSNRIAGGIDYTRGAWTFHYKIGLQRFQDSFTGTNPYSGERTINVGDPVTANELLTSARWSDFHRFSTPVSEFSWTGRITPRLKLDGSYTFFDYSGPASVALSGAGTARGATTTVFNPYSFAETSTAALREPSHIVDQEFTFDVNDWLSMAARYRYSRQSITADADFTSTSNCCATNVTAGGTTQTGRQLNRWAIGASTVNYDLLLTPARSLLFRLGVEYLKRDIEFLSNGTADPYSTRRIKTVLPTFSLHYQPNAVLSVRANVDEINNGTSYTRETPHTDILSRVVTRIRPREKFWIENATAIRNSKLLNVGFVSRMRGTTTTLTWDLADHVSAFAGFSYESLYSRALVNFLRGPAPITDVTLTDQNVERIWQTGFQLTPVKRLNISFAGNYIRVNGLAVVQGERPLYGPMTFPYASGSLSYDVPKLGRLGLQLQRANYSEEIITGNNFGASILLITWMRSF